ncbi:SH3 domain-containing protein [Roseomonas sp. CECT 9278]|uniref:SH3 domain-containing protein n=1 Tax=Roseomonas sp. CECT 9278 TaxID=2845823 RepID=UPI001E3CAD85|nr:SH3 domain-containing protein [Roseomonas sp. CECT 9278]
MPGLAAGQPPPGSAGGAPLREEPGDWWGDVHRWTGSDATRPPRARQAPTEPAAATGSVTTSATARSNIRREPAATAPVQRVARPGTVLRVFGEAPGGWLQVGEGDRPAGWIHRSALQGQ